MIKLYSVANDTQSGGQGQFPFDNRALHNAIAASAIVPEVKRVDLTGDVITIEFDDDLSPGEIATLDGILAAHIGDPVHVYASVVQNAIQFFHDAMVVYAAENITMGITQAGKTKDVSDYLVPVMTYGQTGSLYEVINEIDALIAGTVPGDLSPFVTEARLLAFKQKMVDYLT